MPPSGRGFDPRQQHDSSPDEGDDAELEKLLRALNNAEAVNNEWVAIIIDDGSVRVVDPSDEE